MYTIYAGLGAVAFSIVSLKNKTKIINFCCLLVLGC